MESRKRDSLIPPAAKIRYVAAPNASNAKERLSRAIAILLKAGIRNKKNER